MVLVCALLSLVFPASHACPKECACDAGTKVVDCRGRGLYDIPRRLHPDTQELYLQDNRIRGLGSMAFRETPFVRIVDLSNNSITSVSPSALLGLRNLQRFSLANNGLRELDKRLFAPIHSLTHLDFSHNRYGKKMAWREKEGFFVFWGQVHVQAYSMRLLLCNRNLFM